LPVAEVIDENLTKDGSSKEADTPCCAQISKTDFPLSAKLEKNYGLCDYLKACSTCTHDEVKKYAGKEEKVRYSAANYVRDSKAS
jgi:hypothetical protein